MFGFFSSLFFVNSFVGWSETIALGESLLRHTITFRDYIVCYASKIVCTFLKWNQKKSHNKMDLIVIFFIRFGSRSFSSSLYAETKSKCVVVRKWEKSCLLLVNCPWYAQSKRIFFPGTQRIYERELWARERDGKAMKTKKRYESLDCCLSPKIMIRNYFVG